MTYKVIQDFADAQDNGYTYKAGDDYPRLGVKPSQERLSALSGYSNRQKRPLIEPAESDAEKPRRGRKKKTESENQGG